MRALLLSTALIGLAAPVAIGAQPGPAAGKIEIPKGSYAVDPGHTQVLFTVSHLGISEYTGQFTQPKGMLMLDPGHAENDKVEVSFPIDKVSTTVPALDGHLKTADFFDAAKFPEGKFVSTRVSVDGASATIVGDLTLKGVTKPVTLKAHFYGAGKGRDGKTNVGFAATTTIKRSDWGIAFAVPMISDDVKLTINAAFAAQ